MLEVVVSGVGVVLVVGEGGVVAVVGEDGSVELLLVLESTVVSVEEVEEIDVEVVEVVDEITSGVVVVGGLGLGLGLGAGLEAGGVAERYHGEVLELVVVSSPVTKGIRGEPETSKREW